MSHPMLLVAVLAICLGLAACGERREPRPVDETVFKEQVRALEKAEAVEDQLEQRKRELDKQLERDSGGER
jgi:hypothetical protein